MNTSKAFQQNFRETLKTELSELEILRKKLVFRLILIIGLWGSFFLGVLGFFVWKIYQLTMQEFKTSNVDYEIIWAGLGMLLFVLILLWVFISKRKDKLVRKYLYQGNYASRYKKDIVEKAIPLMLDGLSYHPEKSIEKDFRQSGFPMFSNPARFYASGGIAGEIEKTTFTFSEVLAEDLQKNNNELLEQYTDLFRGVFFIVGLRKSTSGTTLIYPDAFRYFKAFMFDNGGGENSGKMKYQRVKLEDIEFEKHFEVYGTDQTESRYMLSPAFMARIVDFKKKTKKTMLFSFKQSKLYFGIYYPVHQALFRPPIFTSVYNTKPLEEYFANIRLMVDIIKEINLNSRITN